MTNIKTEAVTPSGQKIFITGDLKEAERLRDAGTFVIYDDRRTGNPSFRIYNSYSVVKKNLRREILEVLIAYDAKNPTEPPWKRTLPSLEHEWLLHNIAYRVGFFRSRARDADLDNRAEGKDALKYLFQSGFELIFHKLKRK